MTDTTTRIHDAEPAPAVEQKFARNGKISYIQIPALDVARSAAFYTAVFGWHSPPGDNPAHRSFEDASGELIGAWVTGLAIMRDPGVLPYIYVARIDDALARIKTHAGEIVRDPYPEGGLWVSTFHDPAGNVIGIWQAGPR